jgi:hypothetical protein
MKVKVAATMIVSAAMLTVKGNMLWIALVAVLLILVVVVPAVHSKDDRKKEAAFKVLCLLLGRRHG